MKNEPKTKKLFGLCFNQFIFLTTDSKNPQIIQNDNFFQGNFFFYLSCLILLLFPTSAALYSSRRDIHNPRLNMDDSLVFSYPCNFPEPPLLSSLSIPALKHTVMSDSGCGFTVPKGMRISLQCQLGVLPPLIMFDTRNRLTTKYPSK